MFKKNRSLEGLPSDLSINALNRFEHQYGRTPEIIQLATARNPGHHHGLMDKRQPLQYCGERYEIDVMEADTVYGPPFTRSSSAVPIPRKVASLGGAIAGVVGIDCYSGFLHGKLLKSTSNSLGFVSELIARVELEGWNIHVLAADSGINTASMFQVLTPAVEKMCLEH